MRRWKGEDREPFAAINADPRVMQFLPGLMTRQQSDGRIEAIEAHFAEHGFGLWAVEIPGAVALAGFIGLGVPNFEAHFTPCVEIGWRWRPIAGVAVTPPKARGRPSRSGLRRWG